jgi:hypothetical protein
MQIGRIVGLLHILIVISSPHALSSDPPVVQKPRIWAVPINGDIALTGRLDDARWKLAQAIEVKYEIQPGENTPAAQRTVGVYQFTTELFLRIIGQYDQFNKVIDIYPLFSYKLNPFRIFYAGSTYSGSDFGDPFGVNETVRQYFVKLQYLIRS